MLNVSMKSISLFANVMILVFGIQTCPGYLLFISVKN
jgi:hypothetical protein